LLVQTAFSEDEFLNSILLEVYVALQNHAPALAAMGVRALIELLMIRKVGDQGAFGRNLDEFRNQGFISTAEAENLKAVLEVGSAAIHRGYIPKRESAVVVVDIAEALLKRLYIDPAKVASIKEATPPRRGK